MKIFDLGKYDQMPLGTELVRISKLFPNCIFEYRDCNCEEEGYTTKYSVLNGRLVSSGDSDDGKPMSDKYFVIDE